MNRNVLIAGAVLVVPLLFFLAIGLRHNPNIIESPLLNGPAPAFALTDLDGRTVRMEDFLGQPVVINFWATWCRPCLAEHPIFLAAARRYQGRVTFLGIIYQDEPEPIRRYVERRGSWGATLIDPDSRVAIAYGVYGVPETYIIDAQGIVAEKITGPVVDPDSFFNLLEELL